MVAGVHDAVILPEELVSRELRHLAELVVDVGDDAALVGGGDDRRLIERIPELVETPERIGHRLCRRASLHFVTTSPLEGPRSRRRRQTVFFDPIANLVPIQAEERACPGLIAAAPLQGLNNEATLEPLEIDAGSR